MKTLILSGGTISDEFALAFIKKLVPDYIIGVDRGLEFCKRNNILPNYILGDFDSLSADILAEFQKTDIPLSTFNPIKDATDTHIALDHAIAQNSSEVWILGGTGTRIDHMLCNIQMLKKAWEAGIPAYLVDKHNLITIPTAQQFSIKKADQFGEYVSFFPLENEVSGLTLRGFFYPLQDHTLKNRDGLGVSNRITADIAEVSYKDGILVMIQSKD